MIKTTITLKDLLIEDLEQMLADAFQEKKRDLILAIIDEKTRRREEANNLDKRSLVND